MCYSGLCPYEQFNGECSLICSYKDIPKDAGCTGGPIEGEDEEDGNTSNDTRREW